MCTSELQLGFKPKHSTTQCTFMLNEIIERNNSSLYMYLIFLGASQAFNRVKYCKLSEIRLSRHVYPTTLTLLINMYTTQFPRVIWNNQISTNYNV